MKEYPFQGAERERWEGPRSAYFGLFLLGFGATLLIASICFYPSDPVWILSIFLGLPTMVIGLALLRMARKIMRALKLTRLRESLWRENE